MHRPILTLCFALLFCLPGVINYAQTIEVKGRLISALSLEPIYNAEVGDGVTNVFTDENGKFSIQLNNDVDFILTFSHFSHSAFDMEIKIDQGSVQDLGDVKLEPVGNDIPTILLNENELEFDENESSDISGVLTASRDLFVNTAAYTLGQGRFRARGYNTENATVFMNGIPMNDPENGRVFWGIWGGLNDVMRNNDNRYGLGYIDFGFGGVGGATQIDINPSSQRKQLRVTYSVGNRSYRNRLMATWSSGWVKGGWAFTLSGSKRWAQEGYQEGTFYDGYSYYLGVEKKLGPNQSLSLIAFGAPTERGRSSAAIQEVYDLAGTNYYNPNWGYQNGKKRNAREYRNHTPQIMLTHNWAFSTSSKLTTTLGYRFGKVASTGLDWNNARDPRPDYYRYLPSYQEDPTLQDAVAEKWRTDVNTRQVDWDRFYNVNWQNYQEIENANGIEGNTVSGLRSQYIVGESRYDPEIITFNTTYNHTFNEKIDFGAGLLYRHAKYHNYKVVDDLLGGDFLLNVDRFAERDFTDPNDPRIQLNLLKTNEIVEQGGTYGYDYELTNNQASAWAQALIHTRKVDFFVSGMVMNTQFWRKGNYQSGLFPDKSLGESEKEDYLSFGVKGGATYKLSGRHYLFGNASYRTRPPFMRNAFLRPRVTNDLNPRNTLENITSFEAGYQLKSPFVKARASVYLTKFDNQTRVMAFYNDIERTFGYFVLSDQNFLHKGIELALEYKMSPTITLSGVGAFGTYHLTDRPIADAFDDRSDDFIIEGETIYAKNFFVAGTPMTAASLGVNYSSPKYWFLNLNFSYFDDLFIDFNPNRRRVEAVQQVDYQSEQWYSIINQENPDGGFSLDLFGGKSWKIDDFFLYLNVGINNILNDKNHITGGYEQLRSDGQDRDPDAFPPKYYYRFGTTYFISLSVRI